MTGLHTDGGTEFKSAISRFNSLGFDVSVTVPHTPECNGLIERAHGSITALALTCLAEAIFP